MLYPLDGDHYLPRERYCLSVRKRVATPCAQELIRRSRESGVNNDGSPRTQTTGRERN